MSVSGNPIKSCIRGAFSFKGRTTRKTFGIVLAGSILVFIAALYLPLATLLVFSHFDMKDAFTAGTELFAWWYGIFAFTWWMLLIPVFATGVRRLHDIGRNGLWMFVPLLNLILLFHPGDPKENKYGKACQP